ncbi:unnamed protein product [Symbiodinium pilosum]|uniref:Uncharacterized protein n=1 Tax=Symbiodinium pilosum TaxID=2952 RepID=A0A812JLT0_SYMPI|nr:unnamed protein product [Symbiodinium pilosum]
MEFLSIDDRMTAQVCTLHEHKRKAKLRDRADVNGLDGLVSAPRHRIGVLARLTSVVVRKGCCSSSLLSALLGVWIHILMFRRPLFGLLQVVFSDARHEPRDEVFALQRESLNELLCLCLLAPLAQTDLKVDYLPFLCAMDASPSGGCLCSAAMPASEAQELWRFSEQRGFYTRLLGPASALLAELGLEFMPEFGPDCELDSALQASVRSTGASNRPPLLRPAQEGVLFSVVDLFSGSGHWSSCHAAVGPVAHPGVDIPNSSGRMLDFALDGAFHELCALALRRVVREWHGGPPCLTYGTLRRPRLRSKAQPFGFNPDDPLLMAVGSSAAERGRATAMSTLPYTLGAGLYPGGLHVCSEKNRSDGPSRGRKVAPPSRDIPAWYLDLCKGYTQRFDLLCASCAVSRVLGRWLRLLLLLAGDVELEEPWAWPLTRSTLCPRLAVRLCSFNASQDDQGPGCLHDLGMQRLCLDADAVLSSSRSAALALRGFGLYLYAAGHPRYLLVYAITAVQDLHPEYRSRLTPAWQVDKKWQQTEPGECRPVISQPILEAAVALAICWGWFDWAALTLIGFLCMLHPSEMVPLVRQDIVFPEDAMSGDCIAYVHIRNPKTQRFARRQHCRLEDSLTLRLLSSLYLSLPFNAKLFRGSLHTYRRQWNAIMERLGVPRTLASKGATPGVLRGVVPPLCIWKRKTFL